MPDSSMPQTMNEKARAAYSIALKKIEECRKRAKYGTSITLSRMGLTALPPEIGQLTALKELIVHSNQLTSLPSEISELSALKELSVHSNQLTSLPPHICKLTSLKQLWLHSNPLTSLPREIGKLSGLKLLDLRSCWLIGLPPEIGQLSMLTELYLNNNPLTALPAEINKLSALVKLDLRDNPGLRIPPEVLNPKWSYAIESVLLTNPRDILDYYFAQQRGKNRELNEVKVLVVGESEVGKTSLVRQLRGIDHDPKQDATHGIERHRVNMDCQHLKNVRLNVWDFGGQDIMHATHQFFLTHRSVYLLVLDSRQNERQSRIDYWLRLIASYGGNSPVIVVCNKADQQVMQLNWTGLQRDYPCIMDFAREVSCYHHGDKDRRRGLPELRGLIAKAVANRVAGVDQPLLDSWLNLKDKLENDGRPYLTLTEYHQFADAQGIAEQRDREVLLTLMHQLGSVLHFSEHSIFDRDREKQSAAPAQVEELNVLDPGWVTTAVYKLLNDAALIRAGGLMNRGDLRRSLGELPGNCYPADKEDFILAMMRRFEICFAFDGDHDQWFLPDLLHKDEVDTGDWRGALGFRYQYRVLPGSIVSRLMVRLHSHIARGCLWRTGAKFKAQPEPAPGECEALVRSDPEEARIDLFIRGGTPAKRREFLALIRGTLASIHHSFSDNLGAQELVPVPGHPGIFIGYARLLLLEEKGKKEADIEVGGELIEVSVADALNGITTAATRNKERAVMASKPRAAAKPRGGPTVNVNVNLGSQVTHEGDHIMKQGDTHIGGSNYGIVGDGNTQHVQGSFNTTNDRHDITIHGNVTNSQVGQTLTDCSLVIQQQAQGERKELLESLHKEVQALIARLPEEEKKQEVAENLEMLVKQATSPKPNRKWYSFSAEGLMEASKYVKDFTGNIAGTIGALTKLVLPGGE